MLIANSTSVRIGRGQNKETTIAVDHSDECWSQNAYTYYSVTSNPHVSTIIHIVTVFLDGDERNVVWV